MQIILASQSPYRQAQLRAFGIPFESHKPLVDEEKLKVSGPRDLVELTRYLALAKAKSLALTFPSAIVMGSDQIAELDGERLDKPGSFDRAKAQLTKMSGKTHRLITSLALVRGSREILHTDITIVQMRRSEAAVIDAYLETDQPFDCAGSYKIEKAGPALIEKMETSDPSAIQGLPLIAMVRMLNELGVDLAQLWKLQRSDP